MEINNKIIEEKINEEIKDPNEIVGYCIVKAINFPYPGFINPIAIVLLAYLSAKVSTVFLFLLVGFIIYLIKTAIMDSEKYILVFLESNINWCSTVHRHFCSFKPT